MMKKADNIDRSKLEISLKPRDAEAPKPRERAKRSAEVKPSKGLPVKSPSPVSSSRPNTAAPQSRPVRREPAPAAQPFPELAARQREREREQQRKRRRPVDRGEDLDDFVVSEDEPDPSVSSEIWSMFNRNPRRYEDSDSSDMEAGGDDILAEERRSASQARREDILEEQRLAERAAAKRQRR